MPSQLRARFTNCISSITVSSDRYMEAVYAIDVLLFGNKTLGFYSRGRSLQVKDHLRHDPRELNGLFRALPGILS